MKALLKAFIPSKVFGALDGFLDEILVVLVLILSLTIRLFRKR